MSGNMLDVSPETLTAMQLIEKSRTGVPSVTLNPTISDPDYEKEKQEVLKDQLDTLKKFYIYKNLQGYEIKHPSYDILSEIMRHETYQSYNKLDSQALQDEFRKIGNDDKLNDYLEFIRLNPSWDRGVGENINTFENKRSLSRGGFRRKRTTRRRDPRRTRSAARRRKARHNRRRTRSAARHSRRRTRSKARRSATR